MILVDRDDLILRLYLWCLFIMCLYLNVMMCWLWVVINYVDALVATLFDYNDESLVIILIMMSFDYAMLNYVLMLFS